jgi:selenide, water dikinase
MTDDLESDPIETEQTSVGCGRKLPPRLLKDLLLDADVDGTLAPHVGNDCGVTGRGAQRSLHTVDMVLPMGLDPTTWGEIVALHCVSDIYAAGGQPEVATGILQLTSEWIRREWHVAAYRAAVARLRDCGVSVVGGHSMRSQLTSFGFAITGSCEANDLRARRLARPGDVLVLTKPIGSGLVLGANRFDRSALHEGDLEQIIRSMRVSNGTASEIARHLNVRSSTDVSGFGLLGSCLEIADEAFVTVAVDWPLVPTFAGVMRALQTGAVSPLAESIMIDSSPYVSWDDVSIETKLTMCDPQVSGGLLLAMAPDLARREFIPAMAEQGLHCWQIGTLDVRAADEKLKVIVSTGNRQQA